MMRSESERESRLDRLPTHLKISVNLLDRLINKHANVGKIFDHWIETSTLPKGKAKWADGREFQTRDRR